MARKDKPDGPTRRDILRSGAIAGTATLASVPLLSGTALAYDCPRTKGYWANHDWCAIDAVAESKSLQAKGLDCENAETATLALRNTGVEKTIDEWRAFLLAPPRGDAVTKMGQRLLTTVLNFQLIGASADERVDLTPYGVEEETVRTVKRRAETWLKSSSFDQPGFERRGWDDGGFDGEPYANVLGAFNERKLDIAYPPCQEQSAPADSGKKGGKPRGGPADPGKKGGKPRGLRQLTSKFGPFG